MKVSLYVVILGMITTNAYAQAVDTSYIAPYEQKMMITGFVANNSIQIQKKNKYYIPNNRLNIGAGFAIKNTVVNAGYAYGLIPLKDKKYGKTTYTDFQIHHYGEHFSLDLFYQKYKGFYMDGPVVELHPDIMVRQIGAEGTYLFNGSKFSAKAAFEQSEKQLKSVGSFVIGGGAYHYQIESGTDTTLSENNYITNFQLGASAGYAYSWVINKYWLMSGIATVGANFGNEPELLRNGKIQVYPTAFARGSVGYHKSDWGVSFLTLINNKSAYSIRNNMLNLATINMQISYVKHFDGFFKKKK
ncbi:DUF4421 family protein [Pedobacter sp. PAMC26386]|nr:DUF4421 family protein [Pedobacter sp. PAMC26386]